MTIKDVKKELIKLEAFTDITYDVITDDINGNHAIMIVANDKRCILDPKEVRNATILHNNLRFYLGIS